jgi:hypothetical protein
MSALAIRETHSEGQRNLQERPADFWRQKNASQVLAETFEEAHDSFPRVVQHPLGDASRTSRYRKATHGGLRQARHDGSKRCCRGR